MMNRIPAPGKNGCSTRKQARNMGDIIELRFRGFSLCHNSKNSISAAIVAGKA
jgi:hypothetical protein